MKILGLARVYEEDWSVEAKLAATFGVTKEDLVSVVREVVGARADAVVDDPVSAAGLFAYIHGTRNLRAIFKAVGWVRYRKDNLELVKHPDRDLMVGYQSVDQACVEGRNPQAISGKGAGAERVIDEAQPAFFAPEEMDRRVTADFDSGMWYFCISVDGDDVRAELSLPTAVSSGNFDDFVERIFIIRKGEWEKVRVLGDGGETASPIEFTPVVKRK